ncbi:MAG: Cys-tRNA(Pro) deacylase [Bacteroidota bacterium]
MKKTNVLRLLDQQKITYEVATYEYDAANFTPEKLQEFVDFDIRLLYKTLVGKGNKTGYLVGVVPKDKTLNFKSLSKASGNKKMTLISQKALLPLTGYVRGGCSPMGMKKAFPVFLDSSMLELKKVYVNAGERGILVGLSPNDLAEVTRAQFAEIAT